MIYIIYIYKELSNTNYKILIIYMYTYIFKICSSIIQYRVLNRLKGKGNV